MGPFGLDSAHFSIISYTETLQQRRVRLNKDICF